MVIGRRVPMIDARERVTGRIAYVLDAELPGMLVGKIKVSPHPHARIVRVDTAQALALPGVVAVVSGADLADRRRIDPFYGPLVRDQPILAMERVRFAGEAVAAVAARDVDTAERALELIEVEYEPLPAVFDPIEALRADAPRVAEAGNLVDRLEVHWGDVERAFAEADVVVESEYRTPAHQHVALEPHVTLAQFEAGGLTVWSATQTPFVVRAQLAEIFKLNQSQVRVIVHTLGGGFGGKTYPKLEPLTALLALKARRPVKIVLDRSEDFLMSRRSAAVMRFKSGATKDGRIIARRTRCYYDKGAYTETGPRIIRTGALASGASYRIPNVDLESVAVFTNLPPSGPFRAPGAAQAVTAAESHLDELARALEMDPLELRLRNLVQDGDRYLGGGLLEDIHFASLLQDSARAVGWSTGSSPTRTGGLLRGKGLGVALKTSRTPSTSSASCKLNEDGSLSVLTSTVEMGQGSKTALAQIAAEAAGLPLDQVFVSEPDTDTTPFDHTTSSSRSTHMMGTAIRLAVEDARRQLADLAAAELEVSAADLEFDQGTVRVRGAPERAMSYGALVRGARRGNLLGNATFISSAKPDPVTGEPGVAAHWHHAAAGAEVEVDPETGRVRVTNVHTGVFVGRIVNPVQCELQAQGSAIFGLGFTLLEELAFDDGRLTNPNLSDYMIPALEDLPERLTVDVVEEPGSEEIHGIGETSLPPVAAAIANAVADAIGQPIRELPITPERVLRALRERGSSTEVGA